MIALTQDRADVDRYYEDLRHLARELNVRWNSTYAEHNGCPVIPVELLFRHEQARI